MYSKDILCGIKKTAILLSLAIGFVLISDTAAPAQNRVYRNGRQSTVYVYEDRYDRYEPFEGTLAARQYGYKDGLEDGGDAGLERDAYHPENSGDFKKATNGYERKFGNKQLYKQNYREGYLRGYRDGYRRYTNRIYTSPRTYRKRL
jgi:hypothetical protein